jgi:hypothetical protein
MSMMTNQGRRRLCEAASEPQREAVALHVSMQSVVVRGKEHAINEIERQAHAEGDPKESIFGSVEVLLSATAYREARRAVEEFTARQSSQTSPRRIGYKECRYGLFK